METTHLHPLVEFTRECFKNAEVRPNGRLYPKEDAHLAVHVTRTTLDRALRVMDQVIKRIESIGGKVVIQGQNRAKRTFVEIDGESVQIEIEEMRRFRRHEPTKGERKLMEKGYSPPYWDETTSGKLQLTILHVSDIRGKFRHCARHSIEQCVEPFVQGIQKAAIRIRENRLEREKWERECEEQRERREAERQRIKELQENAAAWHESMRIRQYLDALKTAVSQKDDHTLSTKAAEYLEWAYRYADSIDPLSSISRRTPEV